MKVINESEIEQGTTKWHSFRAEGIGGSEVAMVLNISPYKTAHDLWEIKTGLKEDDFESNFAVEKGNRLEPKIRAMYEIQSGNSADPCLVVRSDKPEHRASLDGRDPEKRIVSEYKYVGAGEKWQLAQEGKLPAHYYAQVQWQLYVTGDTMADYVAYNDKEDKIIIVPVEPDLEYIKGMVEEVNNFWNLVQTKKEPPLSEKDWKNVRSKDLGEKIDKLKVLKQKVADDLASISELEKAIKGHKDITHPRVICHGVKIIETTRKGSVDYKKIMSEHLPDLDTSGYVKPSTTYRSIKL